MIDKIAFSSPNKTSRSHLQKRSKLSRQKELVKIPIYRDSHLLSAVDTYLGYCID